ncbi:unnamed protein product [Microthlaspi erraticum]|uniref:Uncharacterized protein n=1 Tax=Microthlaspi erraticum TaxID=1685480 RepID=A0A6D2HUQ9_9BRAS|nr:unnamed protein product [Microthlaspi erraticum]
MDSTVPMRRTISSLIYTPPFIASSKDCYGTIQKRTRTLTILPPTPSSILARAETVIRARRTMIGRRGNGRRVNDGGDANGIEKDSTSTIYSRKKSTGGRTRTRIRIRTLRMF